MASRPVVLAQQSLSSVKKNLWFYCPVINLIPNPDWNLSVSTGRLLGPQWSKLIALQCHSRPCHTTKLVFHWPAIHGLRKWTSPPDVGQHRNTVHMYILYCWKPSGVAYSDYAKRGNWGRNERMSAIDGYSEDYESIYD